MQKSMHCFIYSEQKSNKNHILNFFDQNILMHPKAEPEPHLEERVFK